VVKQITRSRAHTGETGPNLDGRDLDERRKAGATRESNQPRSDARGDCFSI